MPREATKFDYRHGATRDAETNTCRLYVGNLNDEADGRDLEAAFFEFGGRGGSVVCDRETGKPRGFGFVDVDRDRADEAIGKLDQSELLERTITVARAKAKKPPLSRNDRRSANVS
jgi:RNA recognition motif-containing protein